jgi:hypothetical protein
MYLQVKEQDLAQALAEKERDAARYEAEVNTFRYRTEEMQKRFAVYV